MHRPVVVALALGFDLALGEPPARLHPVVWMGSGLEAARRRWRATAPRGQRLEGGRWWLAGLVVWALIGAGGERLLGRTLLPQAAALKPMFAVRALLSAVAEVRAALEEHDLPEARRRLAWHLVSRDTADLSAAEVAGAAIESLFENLSDGLTAPLLAYRLGGLPLAAVYRYANTADALWGYRTPELLHAGRVAARTDDLLNLLPARLTGLLLVLAAGPRLGAAWAGLRRDAGLTPSPNAGWPMAAAAGALGVRLGKRGVYLLNAGAPEPTLSDLRRAERLARVALGLIALLAALPVPARIGHA